MLPRWYPAATVSGYLVPNLTRLFVLWLVAKDASDAWHGPTMGKPPGRMRTLRLLVFGWLHDLAALTEVRG